MKNSASCKPAKTNRIKQNAEHNVCFNICLLKPEVAMLQAVAESIFATKATPAQAARLLLQSALAHFKEFHAVILKDHTYSQREGFITLDRYLQGKVRQQHAMLLNEWVPAKK